MQILNNLKVALITGGAHRIGAAIVQHLHTAGFTVIIHYNLSMHDAKNLAAKLNKLRPNSAFAIQADLSIPEEINLLINQIKTTIGKLDVLVNNASIFKRSFINDLTIQDWDALFNIHVRAPYLLSILCRPLLENSKGVIINITDIHAQKPLKDYAMYCQSKAALDMQTKALAYELAPKIRVNAIAPGAIAWPNKENSLSESIKEKIINKIPLKRHGKPLYIAQAILALIENPYITGQIIKVDGGRSL